MAPEVEGLPGLRATLPRTAGGRQLLLWRSGPRAPTDAAYVPRRFLSPRPKGEAPRGPASRSTDLLGRIALSAAACVDPWSVRRTGELCGTPAARPRSRPTACGCRSAIERASPISPIHHSRLPSRESRSAWNVMKEALSEQTEWV